MDFNVFGEKGKENLTLLDFSRENQNTSNSDGDHMILMNRITSHSQTKG